MRSKAVSFLPWQLTIALAMFGCLTLCGCGAKTARLSGQVVLKGQPVPGAEIEITPVDDESKNYRGISLADGTYQLDYGQSDGLPLGKYRAAVTVYLTPQGQPLPQDETGQSLKNSGRAITRRYVLEIAVDAGTANINLDLDQATLEPAA